MSGSGRRISVALASLDVFWLHQLQRGLSQEFDTFFTSTWSLKRSGPNADLPRRNIWPLHYALQAYKMFPLFQFDNRTYSALVASFDAILCHLLDAEKSDAYIPLSGVALWSGRKFQRLGKPVILECGSTHTDHQHRVVFEENVRNGIREPLFPTSYRDRVRQEFLDVDFINVPSQFVAGTFVEAGIPESKLFINPYGTDTTRFKPRDADDHARPFRVICPSGVNLRKGARVLAEAWRKLGWNDAEIHWIGAPGPATRHLFESMPPNIVWHGHMDHQKLSALYRSCDVLVLPSFEEGFARVLVEAAASGLALIATPETGVEDFFTPKDPEGWLIPSNNVDALCSALEQAKTDREKTRRLGLCAAARSRQGFSVEDYEQRARENLRKILGR